MSSKTNAGRTRSGSTDPKTKISGQANKKHGTPAGDLCRFPGKMCFVVFAVLPSSLPLSGEPVTHVIVCGAAHQESVWVQEPGTHNQPERFAASCHLARERREMPQEDLD